MIDRLFSIDGTTAREVLGEARDGIAARELGNSMHVDGTGSEELRIVNEAIAALEVSRNATQARPKGGVTPGGYFEAHANEQFHRLMAQLPRRVVLDRGFWRWLSVTMLRDLIGWRHNADDGQARDANFGIGSPVEGLAYRLFIRADLALDPGAPDPYWLTRYENQDLWRSHLLRQNYGRTAELRRALLLLQHGHLGTVKPLHLTEKPGGFRDLAKRLRNLGTNAFYEAMDRATAEALVVAEAQSVVKLAAAPK